jgi:MFS transporter, MHS family, proline/betaine transporter
MTSTRDVSADKRSERPKPIARRRLKVSDINVVNKPMLKKAL